jgi:ATP-binding cassette subfamily B protein
VQQEAASMSTTRKTLAIIWRSIQPYKLLFWFGAIAPVLAVIAQDIIPPYLMSRVFNKLQIAYTTHHLEGLHLSPYLVGFVISMLIGLVLWRLQGYAIWQLEIKTARDQITAVFDHLIHQGTRFHADRFGGALVSQTTKFVSACERLVDDFVWNIIPGLTAFFASLAVLFIVSYKFALLLLGIVTVYVMIMSWRVKHQFPFNRRESVRESERTAALADVITNIATVRAFAHEKHEMKRFGKVADRAYDAYQDLALESLKNDSVSHTMTNTLRTVSFAFGVYAVLNFHANAGALYLVVSYTSGVVDRLWQFGRVIRNINRSFGDAEQMTEILQLRPEIKEPAKPERVLIRSGKINFENVVFHHAENRANLFKGLTLRIKPGEKVGLVGPSGGGKTSLTGLLMRFMDVQEGKILIDGQDIANIRQADLRQRISYVPQEPLLFHRSLRENIRYGQLDASDKVIEGVAKLAHAHEFITQLPQGYNTLVGERGVKLSGGQRQRVAIARALLKNAPILVLDEATSALDSESELLIQDALWKLMENRTAIVIAHRLSTIQKMDRILVLEDGEIVEEGSHKELLSIDGTYARLWAHQSGGFIQD